MTQAAETALIFGAYAVVFATLALYSVWVIRRGRGLADEVEDEGKYWR